MFSFKTAGATNMWRLVRINKCLVRINREGIAITSVNSLISNKNWGWLMSIHYDPSTALIKPYYQYHTANLWDTANLKHQFYSWILDLGWVKLVLLVLYNRLNVMRKHTPILTEQVIHDIAHVQSPSCVILSRIIVFKEIIK